jgi:predicted lipoprotein with Yx(FWY)xxD motif
MASATSAPMQVTLNVRTTSSLGTFLVGPTGLTLYSLSSDPTNGSVCTGQCLSFWPPLEVATGGSASVAGASVTLGSFVRADTGATQVSLDGHALYNFKGDSAPGQTNGEGIKALGGVWHVAAIANVIASSAPSAAPSRAAGSSLPPTDAAPSGRTGQPSTPSLLLLLAAVLALASSFAFVSRQSRRR